ncbi:hypothetical protein WICMUC_001805 [Wickerhamomyces mucosus]|uniref:F-box domain-containing protein n=1 Tax=Wickerhamomyces mucosus TaxID=1378264 RepID=A0A9P8TFT6_9ASCO|nr:hypothetical protein WICMUC_001805 [Wickerhamomyces mucosus]
MTKSIIELPTEIILKILFHIYSSKSPISPFIQSCKVFYSSFEYLIYAIKPISIEEITDDYGDIKPNSLKCQNPQYSEQILKRLLNPDSDILINHIHSLNIKSFRSIKLYNVMNKCDQLLVKNLLLKKNFTKLTMMKLSINSIFQLFKLLPNLPQNLKMINIKLVKIMNNYSFRKIDITNLLNYNYTINKLPHLNYFEINTQYSDISINHINPLLGHYSSLSRVHEEIKYSQNLNSTFVKFYHSLQEKFSNRNRIKRLIGKLVYDFIKINHSKIYKFECIGLDLSLVFNNKYDQFPLKFPELRLMFFDNTSRTNMNKWITEFQKLNCSQTFNDQFPLLLLFDKAGGRLYFKSCNKIRSFNSQAEITLWEFSDQYRTLYAAFNMERQLCF